MARNSLAGKGKGKSKSAKYYAANPEARKKNKITTRNIILLINVRNTGLN